MAFDVLGQLHTAGEVVQLDSQVGWVSALLREGSAGTLAAGRSTNPTLRVTIERSGRAFETPRWTPVTRDAWSLHGRVVIENVCSSGFDLRADLTDDTPAFAYRWRPPAKTRVLNRVARSRFHLLTRAVCLQYPALWCAGTRGRTPLHASALRSSHANPLIVGPSGSGKSTLVAAELGRGGRATSDNLCVGDGYDVWGVVEPMRIEGGRGRRMPHGRREIELPHRVDALRPDCLVVMRRGHDRVPSVRLLSSSAAARQAVIGTYAAGELRRYWGFAATLAAGTPTSDVHPPVECVARVYAQRLVCLELVTAPGQAQLPTTFTPDKEFIPCA
jgi:hypothetical protein